MGGKARGEEVVGGTAEEIRDAVQVLPLDVAAGDVHHVAHPALAAPAVPGQLNRPLFLHDEQRRDVRLQQRQSLHGHQAKVYH